MADLLSKAKTKFDWHIDQTQSGAQLLQAQATKDFPDFLPLSQSLSPALVIA